jgi:4-carboxymuconolactone decarboxylase
VTASGAERLPALAPEELNAAQLAAVRSIAAGPRGALYGPFIPLLRSPEAMTRLQELGGYLRFGSPLDRGVFELAILQVACARGQEFEWTFHSPLALDAGVDIEALRALSAGRPLPELPEPLATGAQVVDELLASGGLADELYERAVSVFGAQGLIDLVVTVGYYTTLALAMNVARTAVPPVELAVPWPRP